MKTAEYDKMFRLEDVYWWFQGRKAIVTTMLGTIPGFSEGGCAVLDLGCGTGLMLKEFGHRQQMTGLDFSPLALQYCRRRQVGPLVRGDAQKVPFPDATFDTLISLDLAEHVPSDDALVREAWRVLKPGGHFLITVPAHPYLWSDHDEALEHKRRYTKPQFRTLLEDNGFHLRRLTYCITATYPAIALVRLLQRLRPQSSSPKTQVIELPRWVNRLLLATIQMEARFLRRHNLPFGVTLVALGEKTAPISAAPDS